MFFFKSYRLRRLREWIKLYQWRYFDLTEWAMEKNRTQEEWAEKIKSHQGALDAAHVPWRLPEI